MLTSGFYTFILFLARNVSNGNFGKLKRQINKVVRFHEIDDSDGLKNFKINKSLVCHFTDLFFLSF